MKTAARYLVVALILCATAASSAWAVQPDEILDDPILEERAREISAELRCLVCQNQSIDDSNASLARDLRVLVRERLKAGDSNDEVLDYIVARYGDYVLLRPPFRAQTWILWLGPFVLLFVVLGLLALVAIRRRRVAAPAPPPPLSDAERARLDIMMRENE
jgi:cytochrome c-type biogenesis protein CcmH